MRAGDRPDRRARRAHARPSPPPTHPARRLHLAASDRTHAILNQQPIRFEPLAEKGMFLARGIGPAIRLSGTSIDFPIDSGSSPPKRSRPVRRRTRSSRVTGLDPLPGRINYFWRRSREVAHQRADLRARPHLVGLYRGIDVDYYGAGGLLDIRPHREARIAHDRFGWRSAARRWRSAKTVIWSTAPTTRVASQAGRLPDDRGARREVTVEYRRRGDGTFGFAVGSYDRRQPLIIDPIVEYSFTFGGGSDDVANDMTVDDLGAVYIGGTTTSLDFPAVNPVSDRQDAGSTCRHGIQFNTAYCSDGNRARGAPEV